MMMTSSAHGTHPLPVEHLDYSYIEQCSDVKYLEKILHVLRAGTEGLYPHLTEFCEKRIELLDPKNHTLRKDSAPATPTSLPTEEWMVISQDLQAWKREITANEQQHTHSSIFCSDTLPPVHNRTQKPSNTTSTKIQKSCPAVPRPYSYWDRYDVDRECALIDECVSRDTVIRIPNITPNISTSALTQLEKSVLSTREREKGNDAFRAGDWDEAVLYYTRSVCILPTVAAYNNRAQAEIKLQRWSRALTDCNTVLQLQPLNYKALLRRATVHTHLGNLQNAHDDITTVLQSEPHNLTAQKLLCEVNKEINTKSQPTTSHPITSHQPNQPIRDTKLLIQEVEDEDEEKKGIPAESIMGSPPTIEAPPIIEAPPSSSAQTRRTINIIEIHEDDDVEEDEDDGQHDDDDDDDDNDNNDDVTTFTPSNPFEFGQALKTAYCQGDGAACAQLLRSVLPRRLPQYLSTQLDTHTLRFITHTMHTHILPSEPSLVYRLLTHLHTAERFTMVMMLMDAEERQVISDLFNRLSSVQCNEFTHTNVTQLYQKYTTHT